ncbi:MAG TPA: cytochrome C552 [Burkholderiales bacterium]|nr:cytochrome C552 [Burkholderiales bacterium]
MAPIFVDGQSTPESAQRDIEMEKLAEESGCNLCHSLQHRNYGWSEVLPIGPSWEDVARKYKGQKGTVDRLVAIVRQGSGTDSSAQHWKGKASGVAMPPNAVEISKPDAEKLVRWILSLDKTARQ